METIKSAVARGIDDEPHFKWWVPYTLLRRNRIIASVIKKINRITHKHSVELPTSVTHAKKLDENDGNAISMGAINREIENFKVAFDILEDGSKIPVIHRRASGHLVFDACMTLGQKAR